MSILYNMIDSKGVHLQFGPEVRDVLQDQVGAGAYTTMTAAARDAILRQFAPQEGTA